jgi:dTDP-4-amino-4,6-dideoxygalactose transaminase
VKVPLFDMHAELAPLRGEIDAALARVLDSGTFVGGREVTSFERELAAVLRVSHAIGTSSGSDALHVLGMALGIQPGDEIVTTPFTFFATAGAFARLGARVVFADVDEETLCLDATAAASACTLRTQAVVTVNLFGSPATIPTVPCTVIEDAAQSVGTPIRAHAAAVSFFPTKNLGALGDAGAVVTSNAELADRIMLLRTHGARPKYEHHAVGGNFRLDALQAAVLRTKLPHLAAWTEARRGRAAYYRELIRSMTLPPEVRVPPDVSGHVYHQFVIQAPRRDELRAYLAENGVGTEIYYPSPLHLQAAFSALGYREGSFPVAERACHTVLALPIHPRLTQDSQAFVVDRIAAFYGPR